MDPISHMIVGSQSSRFPCKFWPSIDIDHSSTVRAQTFEPPIDGPNPLPIPLPSLGVVCNGKHSTQNDRDIDRQSLEDLAQPTHDLDLVPVTQVIESDRHDDGGGLREGRILRKPAEESGRRVASDPEVDCARVDSLDIEALYVAVPEKGHEPLWGVAEDTNLKGNQLVEMRRRFTRYDRPGIPEHHNHEPGQEKEGAKDEPDASHEDTPPGTLDVTLCRKRRTTGVNGRSNHRCIPQETKSMTARVVPRAAKRGIVSPRLFKRTYPTR